MTDVPILDRGTLCQAEGEENDEACFLEPWQRQNALLGIEAGVTGMVTAIHAALSNTKLYKATKSDHLWNGFLEVLFLSATGPLIGPIAGALSRKIGRAAGAAAELGLTSTAWKLAGAADPKRLMGAVTIGFKGIRGQLAHADGRPRDLAAQQQFLTHLQTAASRLPSQMLAQTVGMSDADLVTFFVALQDPAVTDVQGYMQHVAALLDQFEENRIEVLGNQMFGTREVALVKRIKFRNREYLALFESFGVHHLAQELNGAPRGTNMDSLVFVRMVERNLHSLAIEETNARRGADAVEYVDLNHASNRDRYPWARDVQRAIKSHSHLDEIGAALEDDPFDVAALTRPAGSDDAH